MRKYLLLISVSILVTIGLILYLTREKEFQTSGIPAIQDIYQKDTIVIGDSISRAEGFPILRKYFYSLNKDFCFEYTRVIDPASSSPYPKHSYGSLYKLIKSNKYYSIWRINISNTFSHPYNVLVSNAGNYVVVFYPGFYHKAQNILDIYNSKGETVKKFVVEDLIPENRMDEIAITEKDGIKHWDGGELDEENNLVIVRLSLKSELNFPVTVHAFAIDLKTGQLQPLQEKAEPVYIPDPKYPEAAKKAGIEGTAVVKVLVNEWGDVTETEILKSSGNKALDDAALTAAKKAVFIPKKIKGKPVLDWTTIRIEFKLDKSSKTDIEKDSALAPTGPEIEIVPYYKVEEKPKSPYIRIQEEVAEIAKKYGIECDVTVKALIDTDGTVIKVEILKSSGYELMDKEALRIAKKYKFTPARAKPKSPRVWVSLPIKFRFDE